MRSILLLAAALGLSGCAASHEAQVPPPADASSSAPSGGNDESADGDAPSVSFGQGGLVEVDVEVRYDTALRPGDSRLATDAVTQPASLSFRTYFESSRAQGGAGSVVETGTYTDDIAASGDGFYTRTLSITTPAGYVQDETLGRADLEPFQRTHQWHGGAKAYSYSAGPDAGTRQVSGTVNDPSRGLAATTALRAVVPAGTFDSGAGDLVARAISFEGSFEGHFWAYNEIAGGRELMSVRHAGWAAVNGRRAAVVDLVHGRLGAYDPDAVPVLGSLADGRPEKGVRLYIDPGTRHPLRVESTMMMDDGHPGLLIAVPPDM